MPSFKFRGKGVEGIWKDKWIFGNYHQRHLDENYQLIRDYIINYKNQEIKVDSNSVHMFTGVYDKNKKEIYEYDIVRFYSESLSGDSYGLIKFWNKNSYNSFYIQFYKYDGNLVRGDSRYNRIISNEYSYEIIGNIIDNPELLVNYSKFISTNKIIKFKAKSFNSELDNNWYFGFFYSTNEENITNYYIISNEKRIKINPTTLSQYSGFNDSSNNEIYENDILKFKELNLEGIVYWDLPSGSFRISFNNPIPKGSSLAEGLGLCQTCTVIDNYFDRPDIQENSSLFNESNYIDKDYPDE